MIMRNYVVIDLPLELQTNLGRIIPQVQQLWNEKRFNEAEALFREYYELMRKFEEDLQPGLRFHKGYPLHNWGISILLQEIPQRKIEGLSKIFLAYLEDLIDFDTIQQVYSSPAYKTLFAFPSYHELLESARLRVEELRTSHTIPRNPDHVLTGNQVLRAQNANQTTQNNIIKTVFVVHGRNIKARNSMYDFLKSIDLIPINLSEANMLSNLVNPYIGETLDYAFSISQAVIVLMTPDDFGCLRKCFRKDDDESHETELTPQARLNVIFEAGMAMGGKFRNRTILVELGRLRKLSDLSGRFVVRLNNSREKREDLINRLQNAGCNLNRTTDEWVNTGDFESVLENKDGVLFNLARFCTK